jgi:peptidoglycan/LPS O-acetylase OafA/YrhL
LACLILKAGTARLALPARVAGFFDRNDFSYGLYLYHMPVINVLLFLGLFSVAANAALAIALSLCAAAFSWYAVEKPALRYKK